MMRTMGLLLASAAVCAAAQAGDVTLTKGEYGGWPHCLWLSNGAIDLVATTDVGPRIIRLGFVDDQNLFKNYEGQMGQSGEDAWQIRGGHRLWHAPEAKPRTYALDNAPIEYEWDGETLTLTQPLEAETRIKKTIRVRMCPDNNHVRIDHELVNRNPWAVELAPWALTVMAPGGRAIFPQEPYIPHTEKLLPARPLVLWNYTNMADPRWTWGAKYIQLRQDPKADTPQKVGFMNTLGWAAYTLDDDVFIKRFAPCLDADLVDFGCNTETFTNGDMLEVETVGPLTELAPDGGAAAHVEHWFLFEKKVGKKEKDIGEALEPLLAQTEALMKP